MKALYDCIVIGGGPAGLSAALYMGRFLRRTIVLDSGSGRSSFSQINENYLGFPDGVAVRELRELGRRQASRFGVEFVDCEVTRLDHCEKVEGPTASQLEALGKQLPIELAEEEFEGTERDFVVHSDAGVFHSRTVILCTGVCDQWPDLPDLERYVGTSLFWCITCDGFRTKDKEIVLYGCDEDAAATACQFHLYTKRIRFVHPPGDIRWGHERACALRDFEIELIEGVPSHIVGEPGHMSGLALRDGRVIAGELMFSLMGVNPNNKLALDLGAVCNEHGYVQVDEEGYTSVPGLFCAGDLSGMHTHQIVSAVHEGAEAAQTANYYLYADYQKVNLDGPLEEHVRGKSSV